MPADRRIYHEKIAKQVRRQAPKGDVPSASAMPTKELERKVEQGDQQNVVFVNQCGKALIGFAKIGTMQT